ncbi:MAG TPA: DNA mismatch repair endonuclease MutL [Kofleriaceae bacterium]|nr:DNA mismatch repair endonuclease MutL [Kofleriaceae bacterium]
MLTEIGEPGGGAPARAEPVVGPVIRVLPDHVIDQLAAGEVVERPASVVKELVENALDAGARAITIEVEQGGKELIRITDDGCGMRSEEVLLALTRHATSKLRAVEDLFGLRTMGFRGEALPAIAAVSRMAVRSRTAGSVAGTLVRIEGGELIERGETGAPVGTRIEVRELLFNVPARQKFMKGHATEASHITDVVTKLAMAHPQVQFTLKHGSRTALSAPPHLDVFERARVLLGARLGRRLHRVAGEENGVRVEAILAPPELSQTTSRGTQLFVGRRAVRDRGLLHALGMGYGELIPRGRYPVCLLLVDAPDDALDINVHPQKLEVRFSDAQAVYAAVRHVVSRGVAQAPWLNDSPQAASAPIRMHAIAATAPPGRRASELASDYAERRTRSLFGGPSSAPYRASARDARGESLARAAFPVAAPSDPGPCPSPSPSPANPSPPDAERVPFFSRLRYLGQLDRTYLMCEAEGELVLVDQHAAHERVAFQRLRDSHAQRAVPVQRLLFPRTLELDARLAAIATESAEELAQVGFELEPFGGDTFALKAVPAGLRPGDDGERVLSELLDELADRGGSRALDERLDLVLATIACHSVVRAGDALSPREVEALLQSMDSVDFNAHCPHGRPVLLRISVAEIARRFGR